MGEAKQDSWAVASSVGDTSRGRDPNLYMNPSRLGLKLAPPQQHWFKERLRTRVFKERTKDEAHKFLVGRNWTFVKDGLDDFRTGAPPDEGPESVLRPKAYGVIGPNVFLTDETRHKRATGIKERAMPRRGGGGVVGGVSGKTTAAASTEPPLKSSRWTMDEKKTLLFEKSTLTQTSKKRHIDSLETSLLAHPLALYPHIEEGMPSDVFEAVVDLLDPELNIGSEANFDDNALIAKQRRKQGESMTAEHGDQSMAELTIEQLTPTQPSHMMTGHTVSGLASANNTATQDRKTLQQNNSLRGSTANRVSSPGPRNASTTRNNNTKRTANTNKSSTNKGSNAGTSNSATLTANTGTHHSRRKKSLLNNPQESPSLDLHISSITKDFCDWVAGIGGETSNIEEATVASLFASGYETKPALSVPILIVDDAAVPTELKGGDAPPPPTALAGKEEEEEEAEEARKSRAESRRKKPKEVKAPSSSSVEPRPRFRYGAWYLPPKIWRPLDVGEGLEDPKKLEDQAMSEGKIRSDHLDVELAPLHGSKVFIEYLEKRESRLPNFLTRVALLQDEIADLQVEERGTTAATRREVQAVSRGAATSRSKAASRGGN